MLLIIIISIMVIPLAYVALDQLDDDKYTKAIND